MRTFSDKELELISQQARFELARRDFWEYCKITSPDFYMDDRFHLKVICNTFNDLYYGKFLKPDGLPYKKLQLNVPPQHGKSRTLIKFCQWVLGKNNEERIISCSYNDDAAHDFSRYTRDGIQEIKLQDEVVYSDIFPDTKIKRGDSAYDKWALDGQHFNYLGAGIGGSITGKGGSMLIIDDPIKSAEIALNENALEKIWIWYTGTYLSRVSAKDGEPLEIIVMTRWSKKDLCGRILDTEEKSNWYVLSLKAYESDTDQMLCPALLNKARYETLKKVMLPEILEANYNQQPIDLRGRLYSQLKTYSELPKENGKLLIETILNYTDTADEGDDRLCSICYAVYKQEAFVLDVIYTRESMEITERAVVEMLFRNDVNIANIESNSGGKGFARAVARILLDTYLTRKISVKWFHQSENKLSRILTNATYVMEHIYFPVNWENRWPDFYKALYTFQKEGKNKHDDAPDAITGVAESLSKKRTIKAARSPY